MKYAEWYLRFEEVLLYGHYQSSYKGTFESYCNEQFEAYKASEEI